MVKILSKKEWRKRNKDIGEDEVDLMWKASYTKQAKNYDRVRFSDWKDKFSEQCTTNRLIEIIDVDDNTQILDVATGTGRIALILAQKGGNVVGIDLTEAMLQEAQQKAKKAKLSSIQLQVANAKSLPFKDDSFDVIVSFRFFHLMPNNLRRPIIEEMLRVLKPNGLLVLEFANPFAGFVAELYRRWFAGHNSIYIWPHQVKALFAGTKIKEKIGICLPLIPRVARINLKVGRALVGLCRYFPFNHIANPIWYVCEKENHDS